MSRSADRVQSVIDKLKTSFEGTPYFKEFQDNENAVLDTRDEILLSCVIPARNEFPNIVHTVHSILNCWEADGFDPLDIEIIIVNNVSTDYNDPKYDQSKPGDRGTTEHLMPRGIYHSRILRVLYDPIAGNHSARNKGARVARGKYLFFSDAHMSYKPGTFKYGIQTTQETKGLVHTGVGWMGGYPTTNGNVGMGYTLKLGEDIKSTWNNYRPAEDDYFYIPAQGHCSLFVERKQFLDFGGYQNVHRSYGGEFYIDSKWWMFGSSVSVEPRAIGYHLSSGRGYSWNHDNYVENVLGNAYALGMDDWRERTYINQLRRGRKDVLDAMLERNHKEYGEDRAFVATKIQLTFNDLLTKRPWSAKNIERRGYKNDHMLIFHPTWLEMLETTPIAKKAYDNSQYQKQLSDFIVNELWDFVYHNNEYDPKTLKKLTKTP